MRCAFIAILIASLSAAVAAQSPSRPDNGDQLFSMTCAVCHGKGGTGSIGPALRGPRFTSKYVAETMRKGRPGTMMSSFVSSFTAGEIESIAKYVASLQTPMGPAPDGLKGDPALGEAIFFANVVYACGHCHTMSGRGAKVGPDLTSKARALSPRDLFQRIVVVPHNSPDNRYRTVRLTTKVGMIIEGIPAGEMNNVLFFYDTSSLPPILRRIPKADIAQRERRDQSVMPNDYAQKLTLQNLLDVVAFLKYADGQVVTLSQVVK